MCTSPTACDGEADVAVCRASICGTVDNVDDDSACGPTTRASDCGPYRPIFCTGSSTQEPPECPDSCTSDSECDSNAYCNRQGQCVLDQPDGGVCEDAGECQSAHCENGYCCQSGCRHCPYGFRRKPTEGGQKPAGTSDVSAETE